MFYLLLTLVRRRVPCSDEFPYEVLVSFPDVQRASPWVLMYVGCLVFQRSYCAGERDVRGGAAARAGRYE